MCVVVLFKVGNRDISLQSQLQYLPVIGEKKAVVSLASLSHRRGVVKMQV